MDSAAMQWAAVLVLILPLSLASWAFGVLSAGFLRDHDDQPVFFRVISSRLPRPAENSPFATGIAFAILGVVFFNAVPLALLIRNPYGIQTLVVDLAYVSIQASWVLMVWRAASRSRSRNRAG